MSCILLRVSVTNRLSSLVPAIVRARDYSDGRGHLRATEDYKNFRKGLRATRAILIKKQKRKQRMMTEGSGSVEAQEARIEKEREQKAIEANERELERMAAIREAKELEYMEKREKRIEHGKQARAKYEAEIKEQRRREVLRVLEESTSFVTMENLDEKIREALDNEVSYNYALNTRGEFLKGPPAPPPVPSVL